MQHSRKAMRKKEIQKGKETKIKTNKRKKKPSFLRCISRACIIISIIGIMAYFLLYKINNMFGNPFFTTDGINPSFITDTFEKKDEVSILFAGTDVSGLRTDSIIYMKYDTIHNKLYMMSIPRDTYTTNIKANYKVNSIYFGGKYKKEFIEEIENMLDVKMDYYFIMDLNLIKSVVDTLGGIEINIKEDVWKKNKKTNKWTKFLSKGIQTLNAAQIEKLVRNRDYDTGDIKREEVQREVIMAMIKNMIKPQNILKIPKLVNITLENTDTNITTREAIAYGTDLKDVDLANITSTVIPWSYFNIKGLSCILVDKDEARTIIKEKWIYQEPIINESIETKKH